jgi:O-glycosyl hydrolase
VIAFLRRLQLALKSEDAPAHLRLDTSRRRYKLQGFGGNYCFGLESPVTQYTLANLQVAWARTEMSLVHWAPENDLPDSRLRHEFELMQQLNRMNIPYVSSIWQLPETFYSDPGETPHRKERRTVAEEKWPDLVEAIGSYLSYARERYGAEPDLFSFNESNIGIDVLLTAEEHRAAIKRIGAELVRRGLKTRMLLADAAGPRGTHEYALPAANDPEAMRYVGAVGFHSWHGGTPKHYRAWADLAERLGLPLLVTEFGVDPDAHRGKRYDSYEYGMREVEMYQELLLHARPQATIQWEFTADYGIVTEDVQPTARFWLVKHFSDLTPRNADALGTSSDHPKVLFTAFSAGETYTLHVANLGSARKVTIEGLPEGAADLRGIVTCEESQFQQMDPLRAEAGRITFQMPPRSLATIIGVRLLNHRFPA